MRVGVVGLGTAGATLACLLADAGHEVVVHEQATDPRPVGAGIWLQEMGQVVLDRLGLLTALREVSTSVDRIEILTRAGRRVLDMSYDQLPGAVPALGVHRGALFSLLHEAVLARGVEVRLGSRVTDPASLRGEADLVIGADGSRSSVRAATGVTRRDREYAYGALWSVVDDPDGMAGSSLYQRLDGTRRYLGVLPTGVGRASVFWSVRSRDVPGVLARGLPAWREEAASLAGPYRPLLERVTELLPVTYRDVVVRSPYVVGSAGGPATVLVGDAAHAMSPQLGCGTSLALADAWTLARCLERESPLASSLPFSLPAALASYAAARARHVRWYAWCSRAMMPVFQSGLRPLSVPRDRLGAPLTAIPGVTPLLLGTLCGDRTSPWTRCHLP